MPVRNVSNRGGNAIGRFPSLKMQRMIAFESLLERDFIWVYSKLVRDMAYYRCQDDQPFNTGAAPCLITQMPLYTSFTSNSNLC